MEHTIPESSNRKARAARNIILSFALPFFILFIALIVMHITPFGEHSFAITDGKYYLNGLVGHARFLRGKGSLLYSLGGLGNNAWASSSWGNFSPVKLLSLFATIDTIPDWFTWICLVDLSLCGLTMYIMLSGLYGHKASHLIFSTSYALMGFNVVNCFQVLFFIGPQTLPLMVLGLIRLLRGKSPLLYIASLTFCIFCNFYFGLMLCIASVVIFLTYNCVYAEELEGRRGRVFAVYAVSSLIAGLLPCFFWLPALKAFSGGGRLNQTVAAEYQFNENMPFIQIFAKLFTGANSAAEEIDGLPNIFCGILVVALVVLFFMDRAVSGRLKKGAAAVLIFYLLTFYIQAFTLAMHGFTHTNWFPYRYSYVFSFYLIWIAVEEFRHIDGLSFAEAKRCFVIILLAALVVFSTRYEFISGGEVLLDFALLALMLLLFYEWKTRPETFKKRTGAIALAVLVSVNLFANFFQSIHKLQMEEGWELNLKTYQDNTLLSGALVDGIKGYDKSFYRMEKDVSESDSLGADAGLYNYLGVSGSGPTIRFFIHRQANKIGLNWFDMRHWYEAGIPAATDALLGLKYLLSENDLAAEKGYTLLVRLLGGYAYKNPNALSLAVLANAETQDVVLGNDVFENLNCVWRAMTGGEKDIFTKEEDITYTLHNPTEGKTVTSAELAESVSQKAYLSSAASDKLSTSADSPGLKKDAGEVPVTTYIECQFTAKQDGPIYFFDTAVPASSSGRMTPSMKCVGVYKKGDLVTHYSKISEAITGRQMMTIASTFTFAYADNDVLAEYAALLNARDCSFNPVKGHYLTGNFTADADQCILFTLAWDEGWTAYIDGEKVPINKTWDLFMSIDVPEGEHTYEMKFFPAWMDYGLYISGAALVGLVVLMIVWTKSSRRRPAPAAQTEALKKGIE